MRLKTILCLITFMVMLALPAYAEVDLPALPALCYGQINVNGVVAPVGTEVIAKADGVLVGSIVTDELGCYGGPGTKSKLAINGGNLDGKMIKFYATGINNGVSFNDIEEGELLYWGSGEVKKLDLPILSTVSNPNCFIATAAYGSYLDSHVMVLRQFRDSVLLNSNIGRRFVDGYYHLSPPIAAVISEHWSLKIATRILLTPLVFAVENTERTVIMTIMALLVWVIKMRRKPA